MDELVIKYYRQLLRSGYEHTGTLDNPSIFLDSVGERIRVCGGVSNYLHIYINISEGIIDDIKYLCLCDPTANVVVEILCNLVKGKPVTYMDTISVDSFSEALGSRGEDFRDKAGNIIRLLNRGLEKYRQQAA